MADIKCKTCGFIAFNIDSTEATNTECLNCGNIISSKNHPEPTTGFIECGNCGNKISKRAKECPKCSWKALVTCQVCKHEIPNDCTTCPECGDPEPLRGQIELAAPSSTLSTKQKVESTQKNRIIWNIFFGLLRIIRAFCGFILALQIIILFNFIITLLKQPFAITGHMWANVIVKIIILLFFWMLFFVIRNFINRLYLRKYGKLHPVLAQKKWAL